MTNRAALELGSNIDPENNTKKAIDILAAEFMILGKSEFILTEPVGMKNAPEFLNGAVLIETKLDYSELKTKLKSIEFSAGRTDSQSGSKNRIIDIDIIAWNGEIIHKDYDERDFVKKTIDEVLSI